jgi:excisionase family DNA binding protein
VGLPRSRVGFRRASSRFLADKQGVTTAVQQWPLLTVEETAQRLRVSERTVRRLINRREFPALHVGAQLRVDSLELEQWLYGPGGSFLLSAAPLPAERRVPEAAGQSTTRQPAGPKGDA